MDTGTSPEIQVDRPPTDGLTTALENPLVLQVLAVAEVKPRNGLNANASGSIVEVFMVAERWWIWHTKAGSTEVLVLVTCPARSANQQASSVFVCVVNLRPPWEVKVK
jgi:hypothetical protein